MLHSDTSESGGTYDYPEEFGQLAIGVPVNADKVTVMLSARAFEERALRDSGLLTDMERSGKAELHVWAGASDNKTQDTSGWNASASADLNFGIADFSAKFYVKETKNACRESTRAALAGMSVKENMLLVLIKKGTPEQFYSCTTHDFRKWFTALSEATKKADKAEKENRKSDLALARHELSVALQNFYDRYGTGFVSGLKLRAYGIVDASWERETSSGTRDFVIGAGIGASLPFVGFNAAGQYVETHLGQSVATKFVAKAYGQPPQSPQCKWAEDKADGLDPQKLEAFLNGGAWTADAAVKVGEPDNPAIEKTAKAPDQVKVPELPGVLGVLGKAITKLQSKLLANVESAAPAASEPAGDQDDPEAVVSGKQATLKAVARGEITLSKASSGKSSAGEASDGEDAGDEAPGGEDASAGKAGGGEDASAGKAGGGEDASAGDPSDGKTNDDGIPDKTALNLGGYAPFGYYYTPWEEIFPELKLALQCTPAQLLFGQSLVWYSIRDMFAQYLEFCGSFYGVSRDQDGNPLRVSIDASAFRAALDEVSDALTEDLAKAEGKTDFNFLDDLEKKLRERLQNDANFGLLDHYQFWLDHYDWLKQAPFGVVAVIQRRDNGQYYFQENPYPGNPMRQGNPDGYAKVTNLSPANLIRFGKAYRLYPIISTDFHGKPHFAWVGAPTPLKGDGKGDFDDNLMRYSGLMSFTPNSMMHPSFRPRGGDWPEPGGRVHRVIPGDELFNEAAVPMLIHQRRGAAEEMQKAEKELGDRLAERWAQRKRVFGMHLNPGVGDEDAFGHLFPAEFFPNPSRWVLKNDRDGATNRLLELAGKLAHDATEFASVLPKVPDQAEQAKTESHQHTHLWGLEEPAGVVGAYYAKHKAMFFWGPQGGGPGWDTGLFTPCDVKFIPIDYPDVFVALNANDGSGPARSQPWAQAGGGAMWRQPRTDELTERVARLAETQEERDKRANEELKRHQ